MATQQRNSLNFYHEFSPDQALNQEAPMTYFQAQFQRGLQPHA
jgi:hypothetical protein